MFREGYAGREGKCPKHEELIASPGTASLGIETREGLLVGGSRGTGVAHAQYTHWGQPKPAKSANSLEGGRAMVGQRCPGMHRVHHPLTPSLTLGDKWGQRPFVRCLLCAVTLHELSPSPQPSRRVEGHHLCRKKLR